MRGTTILGIVLIVLGLVGFLAGGISYTKNEEKADLGPIDISVKEKKRVAIPPAASAVAVVAGVALLVAGSRRRGA